MNHNNLGFLPNLAQDIVETLTYVIGFVIDLAIFSIIPTQGLVFPLNNPFKRSLRSYS